MIENEIFKRRIFLPEKLLSYGFTKEKGGYLYSTVFFEGFLAKIFVSDEGSVDGKVFDPEFSEEYAVFRLDGAEGAFVCSLKNDYIALLSDIAEKTTYEKLYMFDQTNEINERFFTRFGVKPEFMWDKFPHFGVYRNPNSRKWFAIIMNIGADKLKSDAVRLGLSGEIEVMNLNLGEKTQDYIEKGALPSYHMNKKNWVTVPLNGRIPTDLIMEMAEISYKNSNKKTRSLR